MQPLNNWHDRQSLARPNSLSNLPQVELEITRGRVRNRVRPMRGTTFLIGSGRHCDLVLGDPQFEDVHSYLLLTPQGLVLRHLGFEPELTVDGCPVRKAVLWNQARIRTGPFEFRVHIRAADGQGKAPAGWDGAAETAPQAAWDEAQGPLRVFRGLDEKGKLPIPTPIEEFGVESRTELSKLTTARLTTARLPAGTGAMGRPPVWRHLSELILGS